jgi:hypothetical protein
MKKWKKKLIKEIIKQVRVVHRECPMYVEWNLKTHFSELELSEMRKKTDDLLDDPRFKKADATAE